MRKIIALLLVVAAVGLMSGAASAANRTIWPTSGAAGSR